LDDSYTCKDFDAEDLQQLRRRFTSERNMNSSRYAGAVAVIVFGVGLLIAGRIGAGLAVLGIGILALSVMLASSVSAKASFLAVGTLICFRVFAYRAASNEITGRASYQPGFRGAIITVTRTNSPSLFRQVTNWNWAVSGFCLIVSAGGFVYARKADDCS
jgi:hypothetical protein